MVYRIITIISLVVLCIELLYVVVNAFQKRKNRQESIEFFRSFKKGKCAVIYISALPLYIIGHIYAGNGFLESFFDAVHRMINLVVLKYETQTIQALMTDSLLYKITVYFCFLLVGINAIIFTISLTNQHIWCGVRGIGAYFTRKDRLYIFGNNDDSVSIYKSDTEMSKVIVDNLSAEDELRLYIEKIYFVSRRSFDSYIERIFKAISKHKRQIVLVVNTGDDEKNISICRKIIEKIDAFQHDIQDKLFLQLKVFVFGDPRYEAIYEDVVSSSYGCIHFENKYQKIAMDFIDKYPLTQFMDERQIDYNTFLIHKDVEINVLLIGFGKTNQQIFLTSVANNQFLTEGAELKKVNYLIFDKEQSENNKNLNHSYYRYQHEMMDEKQEDFLPFPSVPAVEQYFLLDINDKTFYDEIKKAVTRSENDANYIVIAFGSDLENIDMAQKLVEKRKEWGLKNLIIFVKVRAYHKEDTLIREDNCFFIGNESDSVFNMEKILGDKLYKMSQMRNSVYDLEYDITHNKDLVVDEEYVESNNANAYRKWYRKKTQMERDSSTYCCLSLRSKLHLMGLDYCKMEEKGEALTNEEYLAIYAKKDMPNTGVYSATIQGKRIVCYPLDFIQSPRKNMAIHEHQRWNSFMISKGMIPASIEQIMSETYIDEKGRVKNTNGKNYAVRRHGNLTTFDGLVTFRKMVSQRDGTDEREEDVIKYDYQLLDDAHWLLSSNGYKIIKKQVDREVKI